MRPIEDAALLLVQNPKFSQALMRALGLKGDLPQFIEPRYNASMTIADQAEFPWGFLKGDDYVAQRGTANANGAQTSHVGMQWSGSTVVPGSKRLNLFWLQRLIINNPNATAAGFIFGPTDQNLINFITAFQYLDARRANAVPPSGGAAITSPWAVWGTAGTGPTPYAAQSVNIAAGQCLVIPCDCILRPRFSTSTGGGFTVNSAAINTAMDVSFYGQELTVIDEEAGPP